MHLVVWSGLCVAVTAVIVHLERKRMREEPEHREMMSRPVPAEELEEDLQEDYTIGAAGLVRRTTLRDPFLQELQAAIMAADVLRVRGLLSGVGPRHPDSMRLEKGLTPLLLAACIRVRTEHHDRRLRDIMHALLRRGALILQREEASGCTVMHLLAVHPPHCVVIHRVRFLLKLLEDYRSGASLGGAGPLPGVAFDPVLNEAPVGIRGVGTAVGGGDFVETAAHLLGMRCYQGMRAEDLAGAGPRRDMLQLQRRLLPRRLQDSGGEDNAAEFN